MGAGLLTLWLAWLLMLCGYDIRQRRLPNWLTLPGAAAALMIAATAGGGTAALAGALALAAVYVLVHVAAPTSLGAGDVKLALGVGAVTGYFGIDVWSLAALMAPLLTAIWVLAVRVSRGLRTVPHGPSMCVASVAAVALAAP